MTCRVRVGPGAPALALAAAAWMCAAHALRHGQRPWVGLCGLLHALSAFIDPCLGLAAALATGAAALVHPGIARVRASLCLAIHHLLQMQPLLPIALAQRCLLYIHGADAPPLITVGPITHTGARV